MKSGQGGVTIEALQGRQLQSGGLDAEPPAVPEELVVVSGSRKRPPPPLVVVAVLRWALVGHRRARKMVIRRPSSAPMKSIRKIKLEPPVVVNSRLDCIPSAFANASKLPEQRRVSWTLVRVDLHIDTHAHPFVLATWLCYPPCKSRPSSTPTMFCSGTMWPSSSTGSPIARPSGGLRAVHRSRPGASASSIWPSTMPTSGSRICRRPT